MVCTLEEDLYEKFNLLFINLYFNQLESKFFVQVYTYNTRFRSLIKIILISRRPRNEEP